MASKKPPKAPPGPWEVKTFTECFGFLPGRRMLTGHALDNEIKEWDLDTGLVVKVRRKGRKNRDGINALAVRPNGKEFLVQGQDDVLRLWALDQEKPIREIGGAKYPVNCLRWIDDTRAIGGGNDSTLRVWDIDTGSVLFEASHGDHVVALATDGRTARDGASVACVTFGGALHVFDWATGEERARLDGAHDDRIDAVLWTNDGEKLVTVSEFDETLRLFGKDGSARAVIRDLPRPARIAFDDGTLYCAIAYQRIDRFRVEGDTLVR